jgi:hypothetical protein
MMELMGQIEQRFDLYLDGLPSSQKVGAGWSFEQPAHSPRRQVHPFQEIQSMVGARQEAGHYRVGRARFVEA